jgi:hypothetical protein
MLLLLCAACENKSVSPDFISSTPPVQQLDKTFLWNGLQLTLENTDCYGDRPSSGFVMRENVITTEDTALTVFIKNSGGDPLEYGFNEFIQIELDGVWYNLSYQLAHNEERLILGGLTADNKREVGKEHTVDISMTGGCPRVNIG